MNKDVLESQWIQIRDILSEKFSYLTEEDIRQINGRYDQLVSKLQQKYGYTKEEAEERIRNWNFDRFATPNRAIIREERRVEKENSFFKWLLALGIPLLLLGTYFLSNRTPEVVREPAAVQEQPILQEAPADRLISTSLRSSLASKPDLAPVMKNIQISSRDGVVTFSGYAPNAEVRDSIIESAKNFTGVRKVVNNIEIK
jgi:uncharacterized protein YjbJ (UPF0337 family)